MDLVESLQAIRAMVIDEGGIQKLIYSVALIAGIVNVVGALLFCFVLMLMKGKR